MAVKVIIWLHMSRNCWRRMNGVIQCLHDPNRFHQCTFFPQSFYLFPALDQAADQMYWASRFSQTLDCFCADYDFLTQDPCCLVRPRGQTAHLTKQPWLCSVTRSADSMQAEQVKLLEYFFLPQFPRNVLFSKIHTFHIFSLSATIVTAIRLNANPIKLAQSN